MLFALYAILFVGGMYVMSLSFTLPAFQGVVFVIGVLLIAAALAAPITASALEHGRDKPRS